ncbi:MAG: PKD domain-containing protein [Methanomicrobiaceae archaeon]|nr:PKD domain-containing protein [Methanomicrobiaceae archaeon]
MPKVCSVSCSAYLIVLFVAAALLASPVCAHDYYVSGYPEYLTEDSVLRWNTQICGENIVWVEKFGTGQAVCLYNLKDKKTNILSLSGYSDFIPAVSEDTVVWGERMNPDLPYQIVSYNISNGEYSYIDSYPANQGFADVSGDYVVWLDGRYYGFANIFLKDAKTNQVSLFRESKTGDKKSPRISGDNVYWVEKGVLYKKPVSGGEISVIAEGLSDGFSVSDNRAVWEKYDCGHYSVVLYCEDDGSTTVISGGDSDSRHPDISGDIVVYEDYTNKNPDISLYDLSTKVTSSVFSGKGNQISPKVSGDRIIWIEYGLGASKLVLFEIKSGVMPESDFSAGYSDIRDGLAPLTLHFSTSSLITPGRTNSFFWDFGDGDFSSEESPEHIYTEPGIYNVSLTVSNDFGECVVIKENYVKVGELPVVDFTSQGRGGIVPYTTRFYEISSGDVDERLWDFGDGTGSVIKNPYHIFTDAGTYNVTLTVTNRYGSVTAAKENMITVGL